MHIKDLNHASRKDPPAFLAAQVTALASTGFSKRGIARHFGVALDTFNRWLVGNLARARCCGLTFPESRHLGHLTASGNCRKAGLRVAG